jgi:hypothetical protein
MDLRNITCYITSLDTFRSDIKYLTVELENITLKNAVETDFSLVLAPDYSYPAGTYTLFLEIVDSSGNADYSSVIFDFYINDKYPQIDEMNTKLKGKSFASLGYSRPELQLGSSFSIEISGSDPESTLATMHAYVVIFSYFTIGLYAYVYEPLWGTEIPFSGSSFSDSLSLPRDGVSYILDESYSLRGSYVLLAILMDSDGQYDDESYTAVLINITSPFPFTLIIIIAAILGALAAFLYIWFRRKK